MSERLNALTHAVEFHRNQRPDATADQVVATAEHFRKFLADQIQPSEAPTPAASEATKPARGRPRKAEQAAATTSTAADAAATPAANATQSKQDAPAAAGSAAVDFLDEEPAAPARVYTKDETRNALVAYGNLTSQAQARDLMETHGKATTVSKIPPENYATVVAEAKKAYDAAGGDPKTWPVK